MLTALRPSESLTHAKVREPVKCSLCKDTGIIKGGDLGLDWSRWCTCDAGQEAVDKISKQMDAARHPALASSMAPVP